MLATAFAIARHAAPQNRQSRQELAPGMRTLSLRERSLLLLAEGKPLAELQAMYSGGGAEIVEHLLSQGTCRCPHPRCRTLCPPTRHTSPQRCGKRQSRRLSPVTTAIAGGCAHVPVRHLRTPVCPPRPGTGAAFSQRPARSRDRDSMLHVGESLLEVTQLAGAERAETIRERMKQLLPRTAQDAGLAAA